MTKPNELDKKIEEIVNVDNIVFNSREKACVQVKSLINQEIIKVLEETIKKVNETVRFYIDDNHSYLTDMSNIGHEQNAEEASESIAVSIQQNINSKIDEEIKKLKV